MAPPNDISTKQQVGGTIYHSHGIEVYHKPKTYDMNMDHDAGFNLQKLAWIEDPDSPQAFKRIRVVADVSEHVVLVEHEDDSRVKHQYAILFIL